MDIIDLDINGPDIPPSVRDLQPIVYHDGDNICVLEGESTDAGIFGRGKTLSEALQDFQTQYERAKQDSV